MKKLILALSKILGVLILLFLLAIAGIWLYFSSNFLAFEKKYEENTSIKELTISGYTFLDRNGNGLLDPYEDDRLEINERVEDALAQMTIEEKIHLLKGSGLASAMGRGNSAVAGAVGTIVPTPRLGLPTIYLSDGPAGLRIEPTRKGEDRTYYCTAFPIATSLSSTWNTDLVNKVGTAMGEEARQYGIDVILGPGVNMHRHPLTGRNFEYYSEDPVLTGFIGAAMVNGIESKGVGTSIKHFVANNQETNRKANDAIVSDRALREIYLRGFELIVEKAQPWTIMSSYNKVNGTYTSENKTLLTDILREDWKFDGLVMTDWFGGNDAVAQIAAGNDLIEPGTKMQWKALKKASKNGTLTQEEIDLAVKRILHLVFQTNKMKSYKYENNPDLKAHAEITRQSAAEGIILLKNEETLPLKQIKNVALLGVTSYDFIAGGTGSGDVNEAYTVSLEEGLANAGFDINELAKKAFVNHKAANEKAFKKPEGMQAMYTPYSPPKMNYTEEELNNIVATSDIAIITIGRNSGEGGDRAEKDDFLLTEKEQQMITSICEAFHEKSKKVVVVLNIGGVIETASWKSKPDAILLAWQGGQEGGNSVADILSGVVNPSGRLPMTFPIQLSDHWSDQNFPHDVEPASFISFMMPAKEKSEEKKVKNEDYTKYEEGIYVGYRHFDKANKTVSYPFGYGLSYTTFSYDDLEVSQTSEEINLSLTVTNTGSNTGKEVVQIYASKPNSTIDRPVKELKTFAKTKTLEPGESTEISLQIPTNDLRYWSEEQNQWVLEEGSYQFLIGSSSIDIKLQADL